MGTWRRLLSPTYDGPSTQVLPFSLATRPVVPFTSTFLYRAYLHIQRFEHARLISEFQEFVDYAAASLRLPDQGEHNPGFVAFARDLTEAWLASSHRRLW